MKLEIFGEEKAPEEPVRLRLAKVGNSIVLQAVDREGDLVCRGNILAIRPGGFVLHGAVNDALGFPLDSDGRVQMKGH